MGSFIVYIHDSEVSRKKIEAPFSETALDNIAGSFSSLRLSDVTVPDDFNLLKTTLKVHDANSPGPAPTGLNACPILPGAPKCVWPIPEYVFMTDIATQTLIVDLEADGYCLHSVKSDDPGRIAGVRPKLANGNQGPMIPYTHSTHGPAHPGNPVSIAIIFKIPRKTAPFKFHVYVRKLDSGEIHDADPQVGNDPPKN